MNSDPEMAGSGASMAANAVSIYAQGEALDDFPVLKAFQQYIDAEQSKARKRMLMLCVFFGALMAVVISVFVVMLMNVSARNQALNDRMIELAMRQSAPANAPVVVQPPQDSAAILAMTAKIDELQKRLNEDQAKAAKEAQADAEKAKKEATASVAAKNAKVSAAEEEVRTLRALLAAEKEKNSIERERQRQGEIEAYRRKHYPEFYEEVPRSIRPKVSAKSRVVEDDEPLDDEDAISYFDDEEETEPVRPSSRKRKSAKASSENEYSIPVEIRGSSTRWNIPND